MTKCRGCGALLQSEDKTKPGYTPKEGSEYCQRCFRLIHYDDLTVSMKTGIDPDTVFEAVEKLDAAVLYVCDLFDFESGMIPGLTRKIGDKDIVLACTKRDLLPDTVSHDKIARFVFGRLKEYGIRIKELVLVSGITKEGIEEDRSAVDKTSHGRPVVVMGRANSGKSTLLNGLAGNAEIARLVAASGKAKVVVATDAIGTSGGTKGVSPDFMTNLQVCEKRAPEAVSFTVSKENINGEIRIPAKSFVVVKL